MVVDLHTHLWAGDSFASEREFARTGAVARDAVAAYFAAIEGAERAVVLALRSDVYHTSNEAVAWLVRQDPRRLVGFASVDPRAADAPEQLERAVHDLGLRGLKLAPIYQRFAPDDPSVFPLYERALRLGVPIMLHQGTSYVGQRGALEESTPTRLDRVARAYPELKIVIAHLGFPWGGEVVALLRKHPNIYTDCSALTRRRWYLFTTLLNAYEYEALDKVFFGSDYPEFTTADAREVVLGLASLTDGTNLPALPADQLRALIERDSLGILGVKA